MFFNDGFFVNQPINEKKLSTFKEALFSRFGKGEALTSALCTSQRLQQFAAPADDRRWLELRLLSDSFNGTHS